MNINWLVNEVSSVIHRCMNSRDVLRHAYRAVHKDGRSLWQTSDGRRQNEVDDTCAGRRAVAIFEFTL